MRLIDADALKLRMEENYCAECDSLDGVRCWTCSIDDALSDVDDAPTVDAQPVKHGEWTTKRTLQHDGEYYCSQCGFEAFWSWRRDVQSLTNYCPNCGAKMDGKEKNDATD